MTIKSNDLGPRVHFIFCVRIEGARHVPVGINANVRHVRWAVSRAGYTEPN